MNQGSAWMIDSTLNPCVTRPRIKIWLELFPVEARGSVGNVDFQHKILRSSSARDRSA